MRLWLDSFLVRDGWWGSGGELDSIGALVVGRLLTSSAFCSLAAVLLLSLGLVSATQCDIQTRARG